MFRKSLCRGMTNHIFTFWGCFAEQCPSKLYRQHVSPKPTRQARNYTTNDCFAASLQLLVKQNCMKLLKGLSVEQQKLCQIICRLLLLIVVPSPWGGHRCPRSFPSAPRPLLVLPCPRRPSSHRESSKQRGWAVAEDAAAASSKSAP